MVLILNHFTPRLNPGVTQRGSFNFHLFHSLDETTIKVLTFTLAFPKSIVQVRGSMRQPFKRLLKRTLTLYCLFSIFARIMFDKIMLQRKIQKTMVFESFMVANLPY